MASIVVGGRVRSGCLGRPRVYRAAAPVEGACCRIMAMNSDALADRVKHAVTWALVAELMRRHKPKIKLTVLELHPGGGQGDTLALFRREPGQKWPGGEVDDFRAFRRLGHDERDSRLLEGTCGRGCALPTRALWWMRSSA